MVIPVSAVILVDESRRDVVVELSAQAGLQIRSAATWDEVLSLVKSSSTEIVILDPHISGLPAREIVQQIRKHGRSVDVVVAHGPLAAPDLDTSLKGMDVMFMHLDPAGNREEARRVLEAVGRRVEMRRASAGRGRPSLASSQFGALVGDSPKMKHVYRLITKTAHHSYPVLVLGESGTGKELVARSIHENGPRKDGPFVPVDCSALAPSLIETELFGHVKGAFTGALTSKLGLMASASNGTLFLDEIGNLPMDLQVKLLRAIQEKEIKPVGSNQRIRTHARIIAATNRDLEAGIRKGNFRQDLYFRLNVVQLRVPPLRERREDIDLLVHHFMKKFSDAETRVREIDRDAMTRLKSYDWPGNVRELENAIERAMALSSGPILHVGDLPSSLQFFSAARAASSDEVVPMEELQRRAIFQAIRETGGDKLAAARLLGIGKTTLYRKLKEYEGQEAHKEIS